MVLTHLQGELWISEMHRQRGYFRTDGRRVQVEPTLTCDLGAGRQLDGEAAGVKGTVGEQALKGGALHRVIDVCHDLTLPVYDRGGSRVVLCTVI